MKFIILICTVFSLGMGVVFDKSAFYDAFSGDNPAALVAVLDQIESENDLEPFTGAIQMKLADYQEGRKEKLNLFKAGREKLEGAIAADPGNSEYRFLRLCIQQNCPSVLKYNKEIEEDRQMVIDALDEMPAVVRNAVEKYAQENDGLSLD